jgi:hypothetical protein
MLCLSDLLWIMQSRFESLLPSQFFSLIFP